LVVEDDPSLALTETIWLEREGFRIVHVLTGEEAIDVLLSENQETDLVLMDIELKGGIDGITAAQEILKHRDIPVVFLSSHSEKQIIEKAEAISGSAFVPKDVMEYLLLPSINMAFRLHKTRLELKEKEKILELNELRVKETEHAAKMGLYEYTVISDTLVLSDGLSRIFGFEAGENKTLRDWYDVLHPDFAKEVKNSFERALTGKGGFNLDYKVIDLSGGKHTWVWQTGKAVADETGRVIKLKGVVQDISQRKKIEEELLHTENLYRVLLDDSSDPIFAIDCEGSYLYVNKKFAYGVNKPQEEIIGRKIADVFSPEESEVRYTAVKDVVKTGVPKVIEVKVNALGYDRYFMTSIQPLVSKYTIKKAVICISKDITERKAAEIKLAEKEKQYQDLFMHSPGALLLEDLDGNIIDLNPAFSKMTDYSREELIGKNVRIFIPPDMQSQINTNVQKILERHEYEHTVKNFKRDGTTYWVELHESIVKLPDGREGIIALGNDISKRIEAEMQIEKYTRELESINSVKDKFFSIISHDLRSPFLAFLGLTKILSDESDTLPAEKIHKVGKILNTSMQRQYDLLSDLLDWSRLQSGKFDFHPCNFAVAAEIKSVVESLHISAHQKNVDIILNVEGSLSLFADVNMFKLVLRNLISNGIKFSKEGGIVKIAVMLKSGNVEVIVEDNGIGIKKENLTKLFRIDARFTTDGTSNEKGTGLGLILCKEIMDKHQGTICAESGPENGTKFTLCFPSGK
jgi:PAS domain S-box-containing protein